MIIECMSGLHIDLVLHQPTCLFNLFVFKGILDVCVTVSPQNMGGPPQSSPPSPKHVNKIDNGASQKSGGVVKVQKSLLKNSHRNHEETFRGHTHQRTIATLLAGEIFGEMAILRPEQALRRTATVKARDYFVELFEVSREDVVNTWLTYPNVREYLLQLAETRAESYEELVQDVQKDCNKEAQEYWRRITRAKTQHAMMKARALVKISRGPFDWPGENDEVNPRPEPQHQNNTNSIGEVRNATPTHESI